MNEKNVQMMYDKNEAVRKLNSVDGFEPKDYLRKEETEGGISFYLDTKYRLLWFRLVYPKGKIIKIPKVMNKDYATFEARIYADMNDAPDNFLANGFASRYRDDTNALFGQNFVETAETAALGRALKDAGFGTQFCDVALPNDETVVDAGVQISFENSDGDLPSPDDDGMPEVAETVTSAVSEEKSKAARKPKEKKEAPAKEATLNLNKNMPYDEILNKLTLEYAKDVVVDYGYDIGRSLGDLAVNKPQSIQFHASRSTNNLIKAAAQFLLNAAINVA